MKRNMAAKVLPYSAIVGQETLKLALELSHVEPGIRGVLVSGERGTGKSTTARAFAHMIYGELPVTLPINATEDRVVGGWDVGALLRSKPKWNPGLLEEANARVLYVDEVNLLDDHIVNLILDVTATGILVVEREDHRPPVPVSFTLVGTMNPEEGTLRPQLLDRFGLMVEVSAEDAPERRLEILEVVLRADGGTAAAADRTKDRAKRAALERARKQRQKTVLPPKILSYCVELARTFNVDGHRGDQVLALSARALAALNGAATVTERHVAKVAPLALRHRRKVAGQRELAPWTSVDDDSVEEAFARA